MNTQLILIDQEFQHKVLDQLQEISQILSSKSKKIEASVEKPMATADVMAYLGISRRTVQNYVDRGMKPTNNFPGKKYYWKADVDAFLAANISTTKNDK